MNVGYRSDDPAQVHRQIEDMISRGIDGVIIDWRGTGVASVKNHMSNAATYVVDRERRAAGP
jgi:ABC-type xylose transport system substrate-binding protein